MFNKKIADGDERNYGICKMTGKYLLDGCPPFVEQKIILPYMRHSSANYDYVSNLRLTSAFFKWIIDMCLKVYEEGRYRKTIRIQGFDDKPPNTNNANSDCD